MLPIVLWCASFHKLNKVTLSLASHRFIEVWITHIKHSHQATKVPSQSAYKLTSLRGRLHISSWLIRWSFPLHWLMNWHMQCSSTLMCTPLIYSIEVWGCKLSDADEFQTALASGWPGCFSLRRAVFASQNCTNKCGGPHSVCSFTSTMPSMTACLPEPNPQLL